MEYYSATENIEIKNFARKWMGLEKNYPEETRSPKKNVLCIFPYMWMLAVKS